MKVSAENLSPGQDGSIPLPAPLKQKIKDGSVKMPGYKYTLTDQQIDQVIAFMKTVDKPMTRLFTDRAGQ